MDKNEIPDRSGRPAGSAVPQPIDMLIELWWADHFPGSPVAQLTAGLEPGRHRQGRPEAAARVLCWRSSLTCSSRSALGRCGATAPMLPAPASVPTSSASCRRFRSSGSGRRGNCGGSTSSRSISRAARARSAARPSSPASSGRSTAICFLARRRRPAG